MSIHDRAAGAVMGALIGEALGVGPHWYYDLEEMRRDYGDWITGYTEPKPHRYHAGLKAGQLSQAGIITAMLLRSVVERNGYDEADFCRRLDAELEPAWETGRNLTVKRSFQTHPRSIQSATGSAGVTRSKPLAR